MMDDQKLVDIKAQLESSRAEVERLKTIGIEILKEYDYQTRSGPKWHDALCEAIDEMRIWLESNDS